jgi:hypothetical protein
MAFSASERLERWVRNIKTEAMPQEKFAVGNSRLAHIF